MGSPGLVIGPRTTVDEALNCVLPAVESLLNRAAGSEPQRSVRRDLGEVRYSATVFFPDAVGTGELIASVFRYRGKIRLDITLEHDRILATPDGVRTGVRCFLNDYETSVTVAADATELPNAFIQRTIIGVREALAAVQNHRKRTVGTWGMIHVARSGSGRLPAPRLTDQATRELFGVGPNPVATSEWRDAEEEE